ncbi:hypothetical protein KJ855_01250 [Patescibacteria group bacterium]|nr:hypothetical protein [Patescibacteria group bacterium]
MSNSFSLQSDLQVIPGIGEKYIKILNKQNLFTISNLLHCYPYKFLDYSTKLHINQIRPDQFFHFQAKITSINCTRSPRKKIFIATAIAQDKTGHIKITWFNNRYIKNYIKQNQEYTFLAKATLDNNGLFISNPQFALAKSKSKLLLIQPVYSQTGRLNSKWFQRIIGRILANQIKIPEFLPKTIIEKHQLISSQKAIRSIHQPKSPEDITFAKARLGFDEIFLMQLRSLFIKSQSQTREAAPINQDISLVKKILSKLPFTLTNSQKNLYGKLFKI